MSERSEQSEELAPAASAEAAPTDEATVAPTGKKGESKTEKELRAALAKKEEEIKTLQAKLAEGQDGYVRMLAEYENYRRRTEKEKEGTFSEAVAVTVAAMLPIADNIARAAQASGDPAQLSHGIEMMSTSFNEMLSKLGITAFGQVGETFDPALHHAVMHEDDPEKGEGEILEVYQTGYRKGDRIIRYAMVKVAN